MTENYCIDHKTMARNSLTPEKLQESFNVARTVNIAPLLSPLPANLYSHPTLVPGEQILLQQENVAYVDTCDVIAKGVFHLTNYRVMFTGRPCEQFVCDRDSAFEMEPEDIARVGQRNQSLKKSRLAHVNQGLQNLLDARRKQDRRLQSGKKKFKVVRALKYSQSVKNHTSSKTVVAGLSSDRVDNSVTLMSIKPNRRPVVKSNLTNISFQYDFEMSIPCTSVYDIRKCSKKILPKDEMMFFGDGFELLCSNIRSFKFFPANQAHFDAEKMMKHLLKYTRPAFNRRFAFSHKKTVIIPSTCDMLENKTAPNFYCFREEFKRMGLDDKWRFYDTKSSSSYPHKIVVPDAICNAAVEEVSSFHRNGCFPTVCWKSQESDAVILRSSSPTSRRGLSDSRSNADERYLATVCLCNKSASKHKLIVFTDVSKYSSNQGILNQQNLTPEQGETFYYPNCRFVHCDAPPPDFKAVRQSANKLQNFLYSKIDDGKYFSSLEDTEWLSQISELLQTATKITVAVENDKSSVLIGYEDGVDRTAQLSSLAQLMLDPYYRTLDGFQVLIQKEWLSFCHKFVDRSSSQPNGEGQGPVCLQWLDCVWQLMQQFPFSFEFNELLLETIADHLYSSRFGTFLVNTKRDGEEHNNSIEEKTFSLWTWINVETMSDTDVFINPRYDTKSSSSEHEHRVLIPQYNIPCLKLWKSYYKKYQQEEGLMDAAKAAGLQALKLDQDYKDLLSRYCRLIQKIAELDSRDETSRNAFYTASLKPVLSHKISGNDINHLLNGSDLFLDTKVNLQDSSESLISLASTASGDAVYYNSASATVTSAKLHRRLTRSRSLDDMLQSNNTTLARQNFNTRGASLKRIGSSKFFTEMLSSVDLKKETKNNLKESPISEKFSSLHDYLSSTGIDYDSESHVTVSKMKCCGYMVKQGGMPKNWKKRWFVLDLTKKYLAYFETEQTPMNYRDFSCDEALVSSENNSFHNVKISRLSRLLQFIQ